MDITLLKQLCGITSPSGQEIRMKAFLLHYIRANAKNWACKPEILEGMEMHSNKEKINLRDLQEMNIFYHLLMENL